MIKSIVNLFFGAENKENTEEAVDYETKEEEEDWLLVNISEQSKEKNEAEISLPDDDLPLVPSSLPLNEPAISFSPLNNSGLIFIPSIRDFLSPERVTPFPEEHSLSDIFEIFPTELYQSMNDWNVSASIFSESTEYFFATIKNTSSEEAPFQGKLKVSSENAQALLPLNQSHPQVDKRVSHPAELSRAFVNHQMPSLPPKIELLEHVKILQESQKAREYQMRKLYKKNQLNRQNKVQLYEGKAKNNRRKDLWQHHSGANNNRKCC